MRPIVTLFFIAALLLIVPRLDGQSDATGIKLRPEQVEEIRSLVAYLKTTYRDREMARNSPDVQMFGRIAVAAIFEPQLIEDLVDLTSVRFKSLDPAYVGIMPPPDYFSPAASEMLLLGEVCRRPIESRIAGGTLTQWQREVLQAVLKWLDMGRDDTHSIVYMAQDLREAVIAKMQKDGVLGGWVELPTNPTPPRDTSPPMAAPAIPVTAPPGSLRWSMWIGVLLAAAGIFWLLLKGRKPQQ